VAYVIGVAEPVSVMINTFGTGKIPSNEIARIAREEFDMRPRAIIETTGRPRPTAISAGSCLSLPGNAPIGSIPCAVAPVSDRG